MDRHAYTYTAAALAELCAERLRVETNLPHLKQKLGMDVLRTKLVPGIHKELAVSELVYNLVRLVMLRAATRQGVAADRFSFVDVLRWLRHARTGAGLRDFEIVPNRPCGHETRVRKRRPKEYDLMNKPRKTLREALTCNRLTA